MTQSSLSDSNASFWDELCGSQLAKTIGVTDSSPDSLKRFDNWYFNLYPYLDSYIPFDSINGKTVLEIGLGYGTVSQRLAESGAIYTGLDIAQGPVAMANHRFAQSHLPGVALQGNILDPQLSPDSFDLVVAIGSLHHTGDLQLAIQHCYRLLKPGGQLVFMVYYAYSYRRFRMNPVLTMKTMAKEFLGYRGVVGNGSSLQRSAYDVNSSGSGAPHTDWISRRSLRHYCKSFSSFVAEIENIDQDAPFRSFSREDLLKTKLPSIIGLDIYASAIK